MRADYFKHIALATQFFQKTPSLCPNKWRLLAASTGLLLLLLLLQIHSSIAASQATPLHFIYPSTDAPYYRERDTYFVKVLKLALEKSGEAYTLSSLERPPMREDRSAIFMADNRYTLHWFMTNNTLEETLIPIRIPLYKGLIGWRLLFIREGTQPTFSAITSVEQLRPYKAVQGIDWPDSSVLRSNDFNLHVTEEWNSLPELISLSRADYFPRSITEIWRETEFLSERHLIVENTLLLQYPAAYYFFVSQHKPHHAALLKRGLENAVADGSFDALFMETFADDLSRAKLDKRTMIRLHNPLMPPQTPLDDKRLWYSITPAPKQNTQ